MVIKAPFHPGKDQSLVYSMTRPHNPKPLTQDQAGARCSRAPSGADRLLAVPAPSIGAQRWTEPHPHLVGTVLAQHLLQVVHPVTGVHQGVLLHRSLGGPAGPHRCLGGGRLELLPPGSRLQALRHLLSQAASEAARAAVHGALGSAASFAHGMQCLQVVRLCQGG